jgi:hypothetical protein
MSDVIRGIGELGDNQIRSALKEQFDELLDAAAAAREQNFDSLKNGDVVALAARLMRKVLGEIAHIPFENEEDAPLAAMDALIQWRPVFSREKDELWVDLTDELLLMPIGGRPSLLVPKGRRRGKPDIKLTIMKLSALKWDAYLSGRSNLSTGGYQSEISEAFGASSWDTIRNWNTKEVASLVDRYLEDARQGVGEGLCYPDYEENLLSDGNRYRMQAGGEAMNFDKFLKNIGKS